MKGIFRLGMPLQALSHCAYKPSLNVTQYVSHRKFSELRYSEDHEWVKPTGNGNEAMVGITEYAQDLLGEIVFVEHPQIDDEFEKGDVFGQIESVKAASELYMPVSGKVTAVNDSLQDEPGVINSSPEQNGWMIKIEVNDQADFDKLMDASAYSEFVEKCQ
mmetsp:Transcript_22281/g.35775  ORF Transcript_22281/g.35775 Transcript_22281/m.35775 type:complete len:161 (-) Transcript_22281:170-652(-)|eukprot:CAMPEP_0202696092 /NCGR_PEP_ID=MMETSP1385-20130828/9457_1 /ASSEMBLY_ACC=CAM_ASM_000861 /TAXON_ID=933848 /ORGANISM="Elphidium margaritaceum" /LENGTH=160 /DNA_ID=CAMNT_0049352203 /DNA_START=52 /DNA_END=534 /DNA_ORIENTATION=-